MASAFKVVFDQSPDPKLETNSQNSLNLDFLFIRSSDWGLGLRHVRIRMLSAGLGFRVLVF